MVCDKCGGFKGEVGKAYGYAGRWCMCPCPTFAPEYKPVSIGIKTIPDQILKEALAQRLYDNLKNCTNSEEIAGELESFFKAEIIR